MVIMLSSTFYVKGSLSLNLALDTYLLTYLPTYLLTYLPIQGNIYLFSILQTQLDNNYGFIIAPPIFSYH